MFHTISFPSYLGQRLKAHTNSPAKLLRHLDFKYFHQVCITDDLFQNLHNLYDKNAGIKGKKINIGGDHSMAIATVAHSLNTYPNCKVIWFDAHPDLNTYDSSKTKNFHGMPLSYLLGLDKNDKFNFIKNKLAYENLLYVGIRDLDEFEKEIIEKYNINYISVEEFNKTSINDFHHNLLKKIKYFIQDDPIHISFDVDCLDPDVLDSTGTPVGEGLTLLRSKKMLNYLLHNENVVNIDITELNLDLGNSYKSMGTIDYLFHDYFE